MEMTTMRLMKRIIRFPMMLVILPWIGLFEFLDWVFEPKHNTNAFQQWRETLNY